MGERRTRGTEDGYRRRFTYERVTWGSHCTNCIATCSYRVFTGAGGVRFEEQSGVFPQTQPGVPDRNPMGCQKGAGWSAQIDSGDRVLYPLRRRGERGAGEWERISWDEAVTTVADAILDTVEESGPEAVLVDEGPEGGMLTIGAYLRFANTLGCVSLDGNSTVNDVPAGHILTFGTMGAGSSAEDTFLADLILVWHANPAYTRIPYFHYLTEARYRGAEVVLIAPDFSPSAPHADYHIPVVPGGDAALGLAMCKVVVDEGLVDDEFVRTQTDLSLLVRTDTRTLLRHSDLEAGGSGERFYVWRPDSDAPHMVADDHLGLDFAPPLRGRHLVTLHDGTEVEVVPAFELLAERLESFEPEMVTAECGVHPDTIRMLARKVASRKTKLHEGFDTAKHYHGDLMERAMNLLLALTGNWGRQGTGHDTLCGWSFEGAYLVELKTRAGLEAGAAVHSSMTSMVDAMATRVDDDGFRHFPSTAFTRLIHMAATQGSTTPPFFFWLNHCGYQSVFENSDWGASPRPFMDYVAEAEAQWAPLIRPGRDQTPRVLIEAGTNALRRTRGGSRMLLENLWPKLSLIVSLDNRINSAGMHADLILPAAHEAERVNVQYPVAHSHELVFSDKAVEPAGEARSDWQILGAICAAVARRADARGIGDRRVGRMRNTRLGDLHDAFTFGGAIASDESMVDELVRDTALSGVVAEDCSLSTLRERGWEPIIGNGGFPSGMAAGSPMDPMQTYSAHRWRLEKGMVYPTLTGRATFYVDHPWFVEAGEELPTHKPAPGTGGADREFVLTGGHPRWSIHACNATNPLMLETTRGHPTLVINSRAAAAKGIRDDAPVRVFNDLGSFVVAARLSPSVRPGQVILYASWEPYGFEQWHDSTRVEAGMVKWLHLVSGWGHLSYSPFQWQPAPFDRTTRVDVEAVEAVEAAPVGSA
ncbi:MAG: molybdopterin-dependent oxidoreductase [Acidimicrobiia bacterium]|nr:molybdopterin-dependent oxidoreductase [Acidimicrobiia bacterium]